MDERKLTLMDLEDAIQNAYDIGISPCAKVLNTMVISPYDKKIIKEFNIPPGTILIEIEWLNGKETEHGYLKFQPPELTDLVS